MKDGKKRKSLIEEDVICKIVKEKIKQCKKEKNLLDYRNYDVKEKKE